MLYKSLVRPSLEYGLVIYGIHFWKSKKEGYVALRSSVYMQLYEYVKDMDQYLKRSLINFNKQTAVKEMMSFNAVKS